MLYGSNAMAGAINIITRNPQSDGVRTTITSQFGSYNTWLSSATNSYGSTSGALRAYFSYGNHFVDDPRHFHSKDDRLGIIAYQNFKPWKGAAATVGFDFDTYAGEIPVSGGSGHSEGSLSTIGRKTITEYSPYITLSQSLGADILNLNAGLRMANSDKFRTQWVPQFGFSVNPGAGFVINGNLAMGYRNPSFRELYLYRMANPDLQPEKMMNYEVTAGKYFSRFFSIDVTAYFSRGTNLIQTVDMKNQNTGRFVNKGIEVSAQSHPLRNLSLFATYSYMRTSLSNLTGAPKNQYYVGVDYSPLRQLNIGVDLKGVGGLYVAEGIPHQNYALLNMKVSCEICRYVSVFVRLENITDTHYLINRGYDMPGFTAMGGFRLNF